MESILYCDRYKEEALFLSDSLKLLSQEIKRARSISDIKAIKINLARIVMELEVEENRVKEALVHYAAGTSLIDNECPFHRVNYKPLGCVKCRSLIKENKNDTKDLLHLEVLTGIR